MDSVSMGLVAAPLTLDRVPPPDVDAEPRGFVVASETDVRIHFLDWGGPSAAGTIILAPGLGRTAWDWAPVARRLAGIRHVVAMDLRGHGLSDAPQEGYDAQGQANDVAAVAEAVEAISGTESGPESGPPLVLAGHGYGAVVVTAAVARALPASDGLVLVDAGWERVEETTGQDIDDALRTLDEPPEVMRSMDAYLADRKGWDLPTWDRDQERAAREAVVETAAGRLVRAVRPHALEASLRALYAHEPIAAIADLPTPVTVLVARDVDEGRREHALRRLAEARTRLSRPPIRVARFPADGHNLLRYRPADVAAAILSVTEDPS